VVSRSTLVRIIRAAADPDQETPLVLGDDFALRNRHVYGTVRLRPRSRQPRGGRTKKTPATGPVGDAR
jgi:hypothetical protein